MFRQKEKVKISEPRSVLGRHMVAMDDRPLIITQNFFYSEYQIKDHLLASDKRNGELCNAPNLLLAVLNVVQESDHWATWISSLQLKIEKDSP